MDRQGSLVSGDVNRAVGMARAVVARVAEDGGDGRAPEVGKRAGTGDVVGFPRLRHVFLRGVCAAEGAAELHDAVRPGTRWLNGGQGR